MKLSGRFVWRALRRLRAFSIACAAVFLLAALARTASAAGFEYSAPPDCPAAEDLADKTRDRLPDALHDLPKLGVRITKRPTQYLATVTVGDDETRTLTAATCDEIVDAIAVIVALRAAKELEPAVLPESKPALSDERAKETVEVARPPEKPTPARDLARVSGPSEASGSFAGQSQARTKIDLRLGTGAVALVGVAPGPVWGPMVVAGFGSRHGIEWDLRVSVERASAGTTAVPPGAVWARWTVARSTGCIFAAHAGRFSVQPCAQLAGGLFEAHGGHEMPLAPGRVERPWAAVGPAVRMGMVPLPILDVILDAAMPIPLVREQLVFRLPNRPDQEAHETWPVTLAFALSVELHTDGSNRARTGMAE